MYLQLKQTETAVNKRLRVWKNLLPEDEDGLPIYPVLGEAGFEYIPDKLNRLRDSIIQPFKTADTAMAKFMLSLSSK